MENNEEDKVYTWLVTPTMKKSVIEYNDMVKDGQTLTIETGWRTGAFHVYTDTDEPPVLEPGIDILNCGYEAEMIETFDGCWTEYHYDECDEETQEWLEEFLEENSAFDLEEHGWYFDETRMIIDCPMDIEKVEE